MKRNTFFAIVIAIWVIVFVLVLTACAPAVGSEYYVEPNPYSETSEYVPTVYRWDDPTSDVACFVHSGNMFCLHMDE